MAKRDVLYHGTEKRGLKTLEPMAAAGYDKKYVYATDSLFEAVIFLGRMRNSLQATWDADGKVPYFCERREGVLDRWYSGVSGSIYVLPKWLFHRDARLDPHEFVSDKAVEVLDEISIRDAKAFLMDMQASGRAKLILYRDRRTLFPDDSDLVDMCVRGLRKYSLGFTLERIRKLNPSIERDFMAKLNGANKEDNREEVIGASNTRRWVQQSR